MKADEILNGSIIPNTKLISYKEIDEDIVFFDKEKREFFELNSSANFIWKEAIKKRKVKEVIEATLKKYASVNKEMLRTDTLDFINGLLKKNFFLLENGR